jgi:hypothetical protein
MRRRRATTSVIAAALAALTLPCAAQATPTVSFEIHAVPIPGFAHTGNILGAGADAKFAFTIDGSEYFGDAPPLIGATFYAPPGSVAHPEGFPTCDEATLLNVGPKACPKGSSAGPTGSILGDVTFGGERVEEHAELLSFFKAGGGLEYFSVGRAPVWIEALATGSFSHAAGAGGYGFEENEQIPLIQTVPEGPDASVKSIDGTFGGAMTSHGKAIYYFRLPRSCPRGGFPLKAETVFAEGGDPSKPETVTSFYKAPCPPHR